MSVTFQKHQPVTLSFTKGGQQQPLSRIRMGLSWQPVGAGTKPAQPQARGLRAKLRQAAQSVAEAAGVNEVDLDASCLLYDRNRTMLEPVWFQNLTSRGGFVRHTGDDRTGRGGFGPNDNESIIVDLAGLYPEVDTLIFTVNSFTGQAFTRVDAARCRLMDASGPQETEFGNYELKAHGDHTALIMCKVSRMAGGGWETEMIGETANGRTYRELEDRARRYV